MRPYLLLFLSVGCGPAPSNPTAPRDPGGKVVVEEPEPEPRESWSLGDSLVIHSIDAEILSVVDPFTQGVATRYELGGRAGDQPVVVGDQVFVTLRDERSLALLEPVLIDDEPELVERWRVEVGPEPRGLLVDVDRGVAHVAVSTANQVVQVDLESQDIQRTWDVPNLPQWLTALPGGDVLVASQVGEQVHRLAEDGPITPLSLPERHRESGVRYTMRATGPAAVDADDGALWIPALYVDVQTPIAGNVQADEVTLPPGYYVDERQVLVIPDTPRFMAALVRADLDAPDLSEGTTTIFAASFGQHPIRGVISAVYPDDESDLVISAVEGARALFVARPGQNSSYPDAGPFKQHMASLARAPDGPRAFWRRGDHLWVFGFLERQARSYDLPAFRARVPDASAPAQILSPDERIQVSISVLGPYIEVGRSLFYSSIDPRMVLPGGGLACATCHIDGGTDGLTWPLEEGPRQTPSLAGIKSEQTPVTWTRSVPTVTEEVLLTSEQRMGGTTPSEAAARDTAAFLDTVPVPDVAPLRPNLTAIERGRAIFEGSAGCIACHRGPHLTDRNPYDMVGETDVRTPTLLGIATTAPYFHDGSAATLYDVVDRAEDEGMGRTNHLSTAEKRDLATYLESL